MKYPLLTLTLLSLPATASLAAVLIHADFDEGYVAAAPLVGQSGANDIGLAGTFGGGSSDSPRISVRDIGFLGGNADLTYHVNGGGTIQGGTHSVLIEEGTGNTAYTRGLSEGIAGQTLYARVVFNPRSVLGTTYMIFGLNQDAGNGAWYGLADNGGAAPVAAANLNNTDAKITGGTLTMDAPNLIVARFNWNGTSYDSVSTWLNPAFGDELTPDATVAVTTFTPVFTSISLTQLNVTGGNYSLFDSLAIGQEWTDVVPSAIPEPSAFALLGGGVSLLIAIRRKRRASSTA